MQNLMTIPKFEREDEGVAIFRAYKTEVLLKLKKVMAVQWPLLPDWVVWAFDRVLNERKKPDEETLRQARLSGGYTARFRVPRGVSQVEIYCSGGGGFGGHHD